MLPSHPSSKKAKKIMNKTRVSPIPVGMAFLMMMVAVLLSYVLVPRVSMADALESISLVDQVPVTFGDWREDMSNAHILPDPSVQKELDALYSQVLSRTYINSQGQRLMLTIAYGKDQNSEATAAHRPEFCYRAQGFSIKPVGVADLNLSTGSLKVMQLIGTLGQRVEPISYWVTLGDKATLPGMGRKLSQIYFGLQGKIADGMLVRVSTIGRDSVNEFEIERIFIDDLSQAIPDPLRKRYFGS